MTPEERHAKESAGAKAHWSRARRRELHASMRAWWTDPANRQRMVTAQRPQWTLERGAEQSATIKEYCRGRKEQGA